MALKTIIALLPLFPLLGFMIQAFFGKRMSQKTAGMAGAGTIGISALLTFGAAIMFFAGYPAENVYNVNIWNWIDVAGYRAEIAFSLDSLSLVFCFVITFVGFLIHIYSTSFMKGDDGYSRFFAYMNLFVASMLILVLADNLLLLYLGWEGVGLCSYLLIGFWYKVPKNGYAARKAFIITRIGDTAMIIGIFILLLSFGTLNISELMQAAASEWSPGSGIAVATAALLLCGGLGKSAQVPLQTWLPDAMAGPSPVSALIHAATMVTAGVYLIARTNVLFTLAPVIQALVAVIGAITLLLAGFSALAQHDLKRILAYSTISQIGYMFLALGVGAWSAAIFHFMIHAFFKALLFLAAGVVILALDQEHDIFKMGGLRKRLPAIFYTFLIGTASLSALPLITAGFYSKDQILWYAWSASGGATWLWIAAIAGAFLTALYSFRMIFIVFFGEMKTPLSMTPGRTMVIPLVILAVLSVVGGFVELPATLGGLHLFSSLIENTLPVTMLVHSEHLEWIFQLISAIVTLSGIYLSRILYYKKAAWMESFSHSRVNAFFEKGWGFDKVYDVLIVKPMVWLSEIDKNDLFDQMSILIANITLRVHGWLRFTQNGKLRWYLISFALGIILIVTYMLNQWS